MPGDITNVEEMLAKAALFVLPSDFEGMPNALMEAMAVGVPCVTTDCPCGGPKMLLEDDKEYLVAVGAASEMAEKMKALLLSKEKREAAGKKMKDYAQAFTPECIFEKWDSFVRGVLKK